MDGGLERRKLRFHPWRGPWRTITPGLFAAVVIVLVYSLNYPLPGDSAWLLWLSRLDPVLSLSQLPWLVSAGYPAGAAIPAWIWLPLGMLLAGAVMGRVFCGWMCPVGGVLALLQSGRDFLGRRRPAAKPKKRGSPGSARYLWLVFLIVLLLLGVSWPLLLTPYSLIGHEVVRLWSGHLPWLLAAVLGLGMLVFPRAWCVYVCPTGLLLSVVGRLRYWRLAAGSGCNNCGCCRSACPVLAATLGSAAGEQCIMCGRCYEICPQQAIHLTAWTRRRLQKSTSSVQRPGSGPVPGNLTQPATPDSSTVDQWPEVAAAQVRPALSTKPGRSTVVPESGLEPTARTRRSFLKGSAAILAAGGLWLYLGHEAYAQPLRPPGAVPEKEFIARCARCGRCIKVCPNQALQPLSLLSGLAAFDTPHLVPLLGRCEMCLLCQQVCPTGAIRRLPVDQVKIGTAVIDRPHCLAWGLSKYCLICVEQCPFQAAVANEQQRPVIVTARCKGCGSCENACPVPGAAVHVHP